MHWIQRKRATAMALGAILTDACRSGTAQCARMTSKSRVSSDSVGASPRKMSQVLFSSREMCRILYSEMTNVIDSQIAGCKMDKKQRSRRRSRGWNWAESGSYSVALSDSGPSSVSPRVTASLRCNHLHSQYPIRVMPQLRRDKDTMNILFSMGFHWQKVIAKLAA